MSVTSAAVARRPAGGNPGVPRRMAARPAPGRAEDGAADAGQAATGPRLTVAGAFAAPSRQAALRVTGIRVREVRVRSQRARRVPAVTGPRPYQPGPVRLTRRGRRVAAGLAMLAVIAVATLLWLALGGGVLASSHAAPPRSAYRGMTQIVVRPGQTLWSIAAAAEPTANEWPVVQQIIDINALGGAGVQAGQVLWVPKA